MTSEIKGLNMFAVDLEMYIFQIRLDYADKDFREFMK